MKDLWMLDTGTCLYLFLLKKSATTYYDSYTPASLC